MPIVVAGRERAVAFSITFIIFSYSVTRPRHFRTAACALDSIMSRLIEVTIVGHSRETRCLGSWLMAFWSFYALERQIKINPFPKWFNAFRWTKDSVERWKPRDFLGILLNYLDEGSWRVLVGLDGQIHWIPKN